MDSGSCGTSGPIPIEQVPNAHNEGYLRTKREKLGHTLHHQGLVLDEEMIQSEHERDRQRNDRRS